MHLVSRSAFTHRIQHKIGAGLFQMLCLMGGAFIILHWISCFYAMVALREVPHPVWGTWISRAINNYAEGSLPSDPSRWGRGGRGGGAPGGQRL